METAQKKFKPAKAYVRKLKRHKNAVLMLHSPQGVTGYDLVSGSADEMLRIWDMATRSVSNAISVSRPTEEQLVKFRNMRETSLPQFGSMQKLDDPNAEEPIIKGLVPKKISPIPSSIACIGGFYLLAYEDGLITVWDMATSKLVFPLIGHTNRVNHILTSLNNIYSSANDCTVRQWNIHTGLCQNVFKFADPVTVARLRPADNFLFTASWDRMVRVIDLDKQLVVKSFVASKETMKEMLVTGNTVIVAGCEPTIRSFDMLTGIQKQFQGHQGWVYCLIVHNNLLFSGGDDNQIRVWDLNSTNQMVALNGHKNGVTALALCNGSLFSASFDHCLIEWNLQTLNERMDEMALMKKEDLLSRKVETYNRTLALSGRSTTIRKSFR